MASAAVAEPKGESEMTENDTSQTARERATVLALAEALDRRDMAEVHRLAGELHRTCDLEGVLSRYAVVGPLFEALAFFAAQPFTSRERMSSHACVCFAPSPVRGRPELCSRCSGGIQ